MVSSQELFDANPDESSSLGDDPVRGLARRAVADSFEVVDDVRRYTLLAKLGLEPQPTTRLGRYVVLDVLGRGGMGTVLKAYDEELDRAVAIKLLHGEAAERQAGRLKREARALARLSHANVVQVYEVGETEGHTFIAMELVKGQTLTEWARREPRPSWRECVQVYLQAGAGLAAAHAEGLVHRDFKPGNAVIDAKGQVRVLDFGLARGVEVGIQREASAGSAEVVTPSDDVTPPSSSTRPGTPLGTPGYMPPEQIDGKPADSRSDQFSFCVSLYETVYGERPFVGNSLAELAETIRDGQVRTSTGGTKAPMRLRQIMLRGLAASPEARWPSMDALLAELRKLVTPGRSRWMVLGVFGGLVAIGVGLGMKQYAEVMNRCTGAESQLAGIWDEGRRQEVRDAILGTQLSYAPGTWERLEVRLDDYARTWTEKHTEVCAATAVRREQSEEVMDRRMGCLNKRRTALNATVKVLAQADSRVMEKAIDLVTNLPELSPCDNVDWLLQQHQRVPPPDDPRVERDVGILREQLADIQATQKAGKYAKALEQIGPVLAQAEVLEYGPLLAEVKLLRGRLQGDNGQYSAAEQDLAQAYTLAIEHAHDDVMLDATTDLAFVVGCEQFRHTEALLWGQTATSLARRSGDATKLAASMSTTGCVFISQGKYDEGERQIRQALELKESIWGTEHPSVAASLTNLGIVLSSQGKHGEAEPCLWRALQIQESTLGEEHPTTAGSMSNLGSTLYLQGQYEEARHLLQRTLQVKERALGAEHWETIKSVNNLGILLLQQGKYEEAEEHFRRTIRVSELVFGDHHRDIAASANNLGLVLFHEGRYEEAERQHRRAIRILENEFGPSHPELAASIINLGLILSRQSRYKEAEEQYQRALQIRENALGTDHPETAMAMSNLGSVLLSQGRHEEARHQYQRALQICESALGTGHPDVFYPISGLAAVGLALHQFDAARMHAERAVSILEEDKTAPDRLAEARFLLARALWPDRAQRSRARKLAEQARDGYAEHGTGAENDLALNQALEKHNRRDFT